MTVMTDWRQQLSELHFIEWGDQKEGAMAFVGKYSKCEINWESYHLNFYWTMLHVKPVGNAFKVTYSRGKLFGVNKEIEVYDSPESMLREIVKHKNRRTTAWERVFE